MGNDSSKGRSDHGGASGSSLDKKLPFLKSGPSNSVVQRHLETARKTRVLTLKGAGVKEIPKALEEVANLLRSVDLSQNKISKLPSFFGHFEILKQLHLNDNCLTELPDEIGNLKKLEILNLSNNNIAELPDTLIGCLALSTIKVNGNRLNTFPVALCLLPRIDIIDASMNAIASLPDEIGKIAASEINLNNNKLTALNPALSNAKNLKVLRVESNALPKQAFTKDLLEDSQLSLISCTNNSFQEKDFQDLPGYEKYEERYTATRRKGVY